MATKDEWRTHLYSQVPLRSKNGDIRLLTVQPRSTPGLKLSEDKETAPTQCFLRLANLKKQQPKFVAISHTCDDSGDQTLSVNGALVPVSQSVASLLAKLQQETEPVSIWIDVLCVNHKDLEERSAQTAQLPNIFTAASSTTVWLGPAADGSDEAMGALDQLVDQHLTPAAQRFLLNALRKASLATSKNTNKAQDGADGASQAHSDKQRSLDDLLQDLHNAFRSLMSRDYWTRLWSLQELVYTSKGVVMCGSRNLDLDRFHLSARALDGVLNMATYSKWLASSQTASSPAVLEITEPANFMQSPAIRLLAEREFYIRGRGWRSSTDHPLLSVLTRYYLSEPDSRMGFHVSDDRDVIFGMVGLATDATELGTTIDYSKNYEQICVEITLALLRQNPKVLQLCTGDQDADKERPSWLVDWKKVKSPPSWSSGHSFTACGPADNRFFKVDMFSPEVITLKGVHLDTIDSVVVNEAGDLEKSTKSVTTVVHLFKRSLELAVSPYSPDAEPDIPSAMLQKSAFITSSGYIGSGQDVTSNDLIAILYGAELPFALRQQDDESYRIVGEVYIHGIMEGQYMKVHRNENIIRIS